MIGLLIQAGGWKSPTQTIPSQGKMVSSAPHFWDFVFIDAPLARRNRIGPHVR
jgi:hypothetical protein